MKETVSIIIPVYNTEEYLEKCLDSLLNQSYKDLEIIVVDDGSKDNSGKICDDYKEKDSRIVVIHKENGGISAARNNALKIATGRYICFVDSDDWLDETSIENLVNVQKRHHADLVCGSIQNEEKFRKKTFLLEDGFLQKSEIVKAIDRCHYSFCGPSGKLFLKSIIDENELQFQEDLSYGEDTVFNYRYLRYCGSVETISNVTYHHLVNPVGASSLGKYYVNMNYYMQCVFVQANEMIKVQCNAKEKEELLPLFIERYCVHSLEHYLYREDDLSVLQTKMKDIVEFYAGYWDVEKLCAGEFAEIHRQGYSMDAVSKYFDAWKKKYAVNIFKIKLKSMLMRIGIL